ncbi:MAG: hypothetical protein HY817_00185 [Candidatus Abawacabacteria bacterium]|nr:hypothetical protein [Candidatus Abawacabacteria bacterium]
MTIPEGPTFLTADSTGEFPIAAKKVTLICRENSLYTAIRNEIKRILEELGYGVNGPFLLPPRANAIAIRDHVKRLIADTRAKSFLVDTTIAHAIEGDAEIAIQQPLGSLEVLLAEAAYLALCPESIHDPHALEGVESNTTKTREALGMLLGLIQARLGKTSKRIERCVILSQHLGEHHPFISQLFTQALVPANATDNFPPNRQHPEIDTACTRVERHIARRFLKPLVREAGIREVKIVTAKMPPRKLLPTLILGDRHFLDQQTVPPGTIVLPLPIASAFSAAISQGLLDLAHMDNFNTRLAEVIGAQTEIAERSHRTSVRDETRNLVNVG